MEGNAGGDVLPLLQEDVKSQLANCHKSQIDGLQDMLIEVNENDEVIGSISKLDAHIIDKVTKTSALHRAFSLFIFDSSSNKLLLQKRSNKKITFHGCWTNSCCSHPMYCPAEMNEIDHDGIKRAAKRRTRLELNINIENSSEIHFITKIKYSAHDEGGLFGEHEIDYILFCQLDSEQLNFSPNEDEVEQCMLASPQDIIKLLSGEMIANNGYVNSGDVVKVTPWFRMIANYCLFEMWPKAGQGIVLPQGHMTLTGINLMDDGDRDNVCVKQNTTERLRNRISIERKD